MAKISKTVTSIYQACRASRDSDGAATIRSTDVAKLIRVRLAAEFPGVKFSVTTRGYDSISVRWIDGPHGRLVDRVISQYSFGGFDGSIDLAYYGSNWLLPDGRMMFAESQGTEGSRGAVAGGATDCPEPGAVLVKYGPKYINASRETSPEHRAKWVAEAERRFGFEVPAGVDPGSFYVDRHRNWATSLAYIAERETIDSEFERIATA